MTTGVKGMIPDFPKLLRYLDFEKSYLIPEITISDIFEVLIIAIPSPMSKFGVKGMRYDFPKPSNIGVSGNPLRAMNETNIKLAKVLYSQQYFLSH